jgi:hypothetical protein
VVVKTTSSPPIRSSSSTASSSSSTASKHSFLVSLAQDLIGRWNRGARGGPRLDVDGWRRMAIVMLTLDDGDVHGGVRGGATMEAGGKQPKGAAAVDQYRGAGVFERTPSNPRETVRSSSVGRVCKRSRGRRRCRHPTSLAPLPHVLMRCVSIISIAILYISVNRPGRPNGRQSEAVFSSSDQQQRQHARHD